MRNDPIDKQPRTHGSYQSLATHLPNPWVCPASVGHLRRSKTPESSGRSPALGIKMSSYLRSLCALYPPNFFPSIFLPLFIFLPTSSSYCLPAISCFSDKDFEPKGAKLAKVNAASFANFAIFCESFLFGCGLAALRSIRVSSEVTKNTKTTQITQSACAHQGMCAHSQNLRGLRAHNPPSCKPGEHTKPAQTLCQKRNLRRLIAG